MSDISEKLVIAISSRALFNLDDSHQVFEQQGLEAYAQYQVGKEADILEPGYAFYLVEKLLKITDPQTGEALVEVILLSRNSADTGLRIFNSIAHYQLNIIRAAFTSGQTPYHYIPAFTADLFLSANAEDVAHALDSGFAAATLIKQNHNPSPHGQLRIAFDGDAVLFNEDSERIYQQQGLQAFSEHEQQKAKELLPGGPFKAFLQTLHLIQRKFTTADCPIRTALVTARSAPAHERVIRTLRAWDIRIDEALFLGGLSKGGFLKAFAADIFFDDQTVHCESAKQHVTTGHVPCSQP
jgi:5'-nucleotidase